MKRTAVFLFGFVFVDKLVAERTKSASVLGGLVRVYAGREYPPTHHVWSVTKDSDGGLVFNLFSGATYLEDDGADVMPGGDRYVFHTGDRLAIGDMQCQMRDAATNDNEWRHAA